MKSRITTNPVLLAIFLGQLIDGDEKHQQDGPLPKEVRAELDEAKSKLDLLNSSVQLSKGEYRTSSQVLREFVKAVQPERFRDAVHAKVGHKDQILVDYGLSARRKARRGTEEGVSPSAASEAERTKVRAARTRAQLERARARAAELEARLVRQEAEAAQAALVAPPEPPAPHSPQGEGGTSEPAPSSETK